MLKRSLLFLLSSLSLTVTAAQEEAPSRQRGQPDGVHAGLMMGIRTPLYVGEDTDTIIFPGLSAKRGPYYWNGPSAGADFWTVGPATIGPQLYGRWQRFDNKDHPLLEGLAEPQITLEGGLRTRTRLGYTLLEIQALHDLLDRHDGGSALAILRLAYPFKNGIRIGIAGGARYQSGKMNDYYYGVPTNRAREDRAAYRPGSTIHPEAQTLFMYTLNDNWSIRWTNRVEWLDEGIRNSPIVDEKILFRSLIGATYRFY